VENIEQITMVIFYVTLTYNKLFMTSTVRWSALDLGCWATERERERERGWERNRF